MKRTKKLLILLISVIALMSLMVLAVSADNTVYYVGDTITAPSCIHDKPGYVTYWQWLLYDETAVERTSSGELRFLKTGDIEIKRTTESCKTTNQHDKKISHEYFHYTVKEKTTISDTTLTVDSGAFCGGQPFPEFTLEANAPYTIEEVSFYHEMCDYYPGDILPSSRAGTPVPMIYLKLIPKQGYSFAFTGTADDTYEDSKYTVVYKGKSYSARVKRSITSAENALVVWIDDVTFEEGHIYATTISDLIAPYHNGPLDKTITTNEDVELVSVRYFRLIKEVTSFAEGEYAYIDVTLKAKDPKNTFSTESYAYWKEEGLKSEKTTLISPTEATFRFRHMTEALPENMIGVVNLSVSEPQTNAVVSHTAANADTFGITVNNLSWTPDDETFGGGVAYTAKVEFTVADTYTFVDSFLTNGVVYINGETASVVQKTVKTLNGRPRPVENTYIASVTFYPMEIEEEYVFPFTDVKTTDWYYSFVEASHQMGLLNGTSDTTYAPNTDLTVAAAVKLAACMNILYNGGDPNNDISVGRDVWYSTYMAYALQHGIIDTDLSSRQAEKITRSEYVYMFSRALPAEAFKEINTVAVGSIPDVKNCKTKYEQAIYKFYRAGIVIGNSAGEFMPDNTISRAEVATILVRMMDASFRVKK